MHNWTLIGVFYRKHSREKLWILEMPEMTDMYRGIMSVCIFIHQLASLKFFSSYLIYFGVSDTPPGLSATEAFTFHAYGLLTALWITQV